MTPSGLLVSNNRRIAGPTAKGGSGIVYERAGLIEIDLIKKFVMDNSVVAALQVGPLVVDPGGTNGIRRNDFDRQNRSAICRDRSSQIVIVVVIGGLSLFEMGEVLSVREADGGFDCERALNLDGGPSTAVSFSMDGKSVEVMGRWKISNGLAVKSR
jgi:exopolysaccharide biosynthesis protein